eukprot:m.98416 g.98416  ORF g.98416 m.98416 type:complete len:192 (+) comp12427_c0_seq3:117-692(+)
MLRSSFALCCAVGRSTQALVRPSLQSSLRRSWLSESTRDESAGKSFIELAKEQGMASMIGRQFPSKGGYDSVLSENLVVTTVNADSVVACVKVTEPLANAFNTLHGGAIATLVDVLGTMALLAQDSSRPGVSVEINVTYMSAAKVGSDITVEGSVLKLGRSLGFTEVRLSDTMTGKLIAVGRHTKAFPQQS